MSLECEHPFAEGDGCQKPRTLHLSASLGKLFQPRTTTLFGIPFSPIKQVDRPYLYQQFGMFGVYDGHNGHMCSDALYAELHVAVAKHPTFHQAPRKV